MPEFEFTLKNYKIKFYRFTALLIVFFNVAVFIFYFIAAKYFYELISLLCLITLYGFFRYYVVKKNISAFYVNELSFIILAVCWAVLQNYWIAVGCVLVGILYHFSLQKIQFVFNTDFIKKINFPPATYLWSQFNNVMLRDDILTLDFNNNKLIQCEIENVQRTPNGENNINEDEFNKFAQQQLIKNAHLEEKVHLR